MSSDRNGVRVVLDLKKEAYPNKILNQLYKLTQMQCAFQCQCTCTDRRIQPRVMTLKMVLEEFVGSIAFLS
jgi:DNA gyrase subunit A